MTPTRRPAYKPSLMVGGMRCIIKAAPGLSAREWGTISRAVSAMVSNVAPSRHGSMYIEAEHSRQSSSSADYVSMNIWLPDRAGRFTRVIMDRPSDLWFNYRVNAETAVCEANMEVKYA